MPITKNLTKIGSSYAVILDKSVLQLLGISPDSKISMDIKGDTLLLRKNEEPSLVQEPRVPFSKAVDNSIRKFDTTYHKLADA